MAASSGSVRSHICAPLLSTDMMGRLVVVSALLVPVVVAVAPSEVGAATIAVTTTADTVASDAVTSLREAISEADANPGADTITLSAATYELSLSCGSDEDANAGGDLDIGAFEGLVIQGPSSLSKATITLGSGCTDERLLDVVAFGPLTLRNLILDGGRAKDATGPDLDGADGGAVRVRGGSLEAENVVFSDNSAGSGGRAETTNSEGGDGGAIYAEGALVLTSCTFTGNAAGDGYSAGTSPGEALGGEGGAVYLLSSSAAVTITDSEFISNSAGDGGDSSGAWGGSGGTGGALVFRGGAMTITGSQFTGNSAGAGGASTTHQVRAGASGGALYLVANGVGSVTVSGSEFTGNVAGTAGPGVDGAGAGGDGGAIAANAVGIELQVDIDTTDFLSNVAGSASQIASSGSALVNRGGSGGAISARGASTSLTVMSSTFQTNTAGVGASYVSGAGSVAGGPGGDGGAIGVLGSSVSVVGSVFQSNSGGAGGVGSAGTSGVGGHGGAIGGDTLSLDQPSLSVSGSQFISNAVGVGVRDGVGSFGFDAAGRGGAISMFSRLTSDALVVDRSYFVGNSAASGENPDGQDPDAGDGGAVWFGGTSSTGSISNSTFESNAADGGGGAVYADSGSSLSISFSTFGAHDAGAGLAEVLGLGGSDSPAMSVSASVLLGVVGGPGVTCDTGVTSAGYNRELVSSDCTGWASTDDQRGLAAGLLGPLTSQGGTAGESRVPAAALRDVIGPGVLLCAEAGADQRGVTRAIGDGCDLGAVEVASSVDAVDDSYDVSGLEPVVLQVTANDTSSSESAIIVPDAVEVFVDEGRSDLSAFMSEITFTPSAFGTSTFDYTICNATELVCDTATVTVTVQPSTSQMFFPVTPDRLFDTRPEKPQGAVTVSQRKVGGTTTLSVKVTGKVGVPASGVAAVALNVTSTQQDGNGYVTVYPCGALPSTSNLNFQVGVSVPNMVIAPVSAGGKVCFYASVGTHLIADVSGWFAEEAGFEALTPDRLFDTRPEKPQGSISVTKSKVGPSRTLTVKVTGKSGIPSSGVAAVALNVTSTQQDGNGYVTVYPCGTVPSTSNLNFQPGVSVPNMVIAPVSPTGRVCFYANTDTHVIADVSGWFADGSTFTAVDPARVFDTRPEKPQGEVSVSKRKVGGGYELSVKVTGVGGVPLSGVGAVSLNVTSTQQNGNGYVTVYPCGDLPTTSNLNFRPGVTVPNAVIAPVDIVTGKVCFYASVDTHLLADVAGWFEIFPD